MNGETADQFPYTRMPGMPFSVGSSDSRGKLDEMPDSDKLPGVSRYHGESRIVMPGRLRHKKGRIMHWILLESTGNRQVVQADKRQLAQMFDLDIPVRDLRFVEVVGSSNTPAQLLPRDRSTMLSLEHVRLIVTHDKVMLPVDDERSKEVERFVSLLTGMIAERTMESSTHSDDNFRCSQSGNNQEASKYQGMDVLPFELAVLEIALGEVCDGLSREAAGLQAAAGPALEDLMRNADTATLERVRRVKTSHQRLMDRMTSVRDAIERVMEDDEDMWRLCLTRKRTLIGGVPFSAVAQAALHHHHNSPGMRSLGTSEIDLTHLLGPSPPSWPMLAALARPQSGELTGIEQYHHDLLEVENLLESYFLSADSTLQQLRALGEYIDDTEDLINIQLDYSRNKLIRIDILITSSTFCLAFLSCVAGILGENLVLPDAITQDLGAWIIINAGVGIFCVLLLLLTYWNLKRMRIL